MTNLNDSIDMLILMHRQRKSWIEARKRLILQAKAVARTFTDGDKTKAANLYDDVVKGTSDDHGAMIALMPFVSAQEPFAADINAVEKQMKKLAKTLPVYDFVEEVKGFGDISLAMLIAETGPLDHYPSVPKLWKRCGLAVIDGKRQRRVAGDEDLALLHGYSPLRRALLWNITECIIKAQIRKDVGPIGPYGELYFREKERQLGKGLTAGHAHNRSKRHMSKKMLKHLWYEWSRHT